MGGFGRRFTVRPGDRTLIGLIWLSFLILKFNQEIQFNQSNQCSN